MTSIAMKISDMSSEQIAEKLYKIILIGDPGVGKTSFMQRYVRNAYPVNYKMTVGVDFMVKVVKRDDIKMKLQLWDIAGQERFSQVTRVYYKNARACIIMFDITNRESFASVVRWKNDLDAKCFLEDGSPVPCVLLGNKCDLVNERRVSAEEAEVLCRDLMFVGWNETSSKENIRVEQSMDFLLEEMLKKESFMMEQDEEEEKDQRENLKTVRLQSPCLCGSEEGMGCLRC